MENNTIQFSMQNLNDWQILSILGRIDTITANLAETTAMEMLSTHTKLALDLSDLDYISSAGLRILLRLAKKAKNQQKSFTLVNPQGLVKEILEESGLDILFTTVKTIEELA